MWQATVRQGPGVTQSACALVGSRIRVQKPLRPPRHGVDLNRPVRDAGRRTGSRRKVTHGAVRNRCPGQKRSLSPRHRKSKRRYLGATPHQPGQRLRGSRLLPRLGESLRGPNSTRPSSAGHRQEAKPSPRSRKTVLRQRFSTWSRGPEGSCGNSWESQKSLPLKRRACAPRCRQTPKPCVSMPKVWISFVSSMPFQPGTS